MRKHKAMLLLAVMMALIAIPAPWALAETADTAAGIDLTPLLQAVIALLASIITIKVIPYLNAKLTAQQRAALEAATRVAVYAAEQLYGSGTGQDKLKYVKEQLAVRGYTVDIPAIEAAVRELTISQGKTHTAELGATTATNPGNS